MLIQAENGNVRWQSGNQLLEARFAHKAKARVMVAAFRIVPVRYNDKIEAEMGDLLEGEEPFLMPDKKGVGKGIKRPAPKRDETLYDL